MPRLAIALSLFGCLALAGCGSDDRGDACVPGAQSACACGAGAAGTQICAADGRSFGACLCGGAITDGGGATDGGAPVGGGCQSTLANDPQNCGRCGHDCLGGACVGGACQPSVISTKHPNRFVSDGKFLYFSLGTSLVYRMPVTGGVEEDWGGNGADVTTDRILMDDQAIYVMLKPIASGTTQIMRLDKATAALTILVTQAIDGAIAQDANNVYWTSPAEALYKVSKSGGAATRVTPDHTLGTWGGVGLYPFATLLAQNGEVYGRGVPSYDIVAVRASDGNSQMLVPTRADVADLNASTLVWSYGALWSVPLAGGSPLKISTSAPDLLQIDDQDVYWASQDAAYSIMRTPIKGGPTAMLTAPKTASLESVLWITLDDRAIYWSDWDGFYRLAK